MTAPTIAASFRVHNDSRLPWTPEDGFAVSYQVFDPESGTLVAEGPRTRLPRPLHPGETLDIPIEAALPSEPARYRVFVSSMQENVGWHHQAGRRFLVLDAEVAAGQARILGSAETTRGSLRRARVRHSLQRALTLPFALTWRNRGLIRSMVRRDILGRYRGSFGGVFWTVLNPLLLIATYFFVFGVVLRTRFGADGSQAGFALYFLCGMLPWLAFSEAAGRAPWIIVEHRNFVKKLVFPLETLPVNLVMAGLVTEVFALAIFTVFLLAARGAVPPTVFWLPALLVPQVLFTAGLCWFLAALGVYVRDLGQVSGFLLTLWFFLTPICYPAESLPAAALGVLSANPMFVLVRAYRDVFLAARPPAPAPLCALWIVAALVFILGHAWFYRLRKTFADVI